MSSDASIASFARDLPTRDPPEPAFAGDEPLQLAPWPAALEDDALHGLAGDFVRLIEPHTESDPPALLFQFLVAFGNIVGRGPYFQVEATRHHANTNVVVVGRTSKGRKGTGWGHVLRVLGALQDKWAADRVQDGLGSGEGLIWAVRDPIYKTEPIKKRGGDILGYRQVMVDAGVEDKRLLIAATEFSSPLRVAVREGNTLSAVVRNAWDTGSLRVVVKNAPATATGAHVSIVGHITKPELLSDMSAIDAANGFGNRFLWVASERSKSLPDGGAVPDAGLLRLQTRVATACEVARGFTAMTRSPGAQALWRVAYPVLSEGKPGLLGAILGRAEAQVTRLSLIFALLDASRVIEERHLRAALAAWKYVEDTAAFVFGTKLGNRIADRIRAELNTAGPAGMTKTAIRDLFGNHGHTEAINEALALLYDSGLARQEMIPGKGRAAETWFAGRAPAKKAIKAKEGSEDAPLPSLPSHLSQGLQPVPATSGHPTADAGRPAPRSELLSNEPAPVVVGPIVHDDDPEVEVTL
jgi:hypothetical protein